MRAVTAPIRGGESRAVLRSREHSAWGCPGEGCPRGQEEEGGRRQRGSRLWSSPAPGKRLARIPAPVGSVVFIRWLGHLDFLFSCPEAGCGCGMGVLRTERRALSSDLPVGGEVRSQGELADAGAPISFVAFLTETSHPAAREFCLKPWDYLLNPIDSPCYTSGSLTLMEAQASCETKQETKQKPQTSLQLFPWGGGPCSSRPRSIHSQ